MAHSGETKPFLTARELTVMAMLTALLFVQEQLLNFLPNINFTILLMLLYAKTFGFIKSGMMITVYLVLDAVFMAAVNPVFVVFQWLGWMTIPLLCSTLFRKTEDSVKLAFAGALCALLYCWLMMIPSVFIYRIPFMAYIVPDLPFEAILAASAFLGILLLYEPLRKLLRKLLKTQD